MPKKKRNYRKKRAVEASAEATEEELAVVREKLEERREEQKFRRRAQGVSAAVLMEGEMDPESEGWSLATGGLMPKSRKPKADAEFSTALNTAFEAETNRRTQDDDMLKYIDEQMAKKDKAAQPPKEKSEYEEMQEALYKVPDRLETMAKEVQERLDAEQRASTGMYSSQILSGIPEVDLGIDVKIRNIEATEKLKAKVVAKRGTKPVSKMDEVRKLNIEPLDTTKSYFRDRYSGGNVKEKLKLSDPHEHVTQFEREKKRALDSGEVETATFTLPADELVASRWEHRKPTASDDLAFDRFRKKQRYNRF